MKKLTLAIAVLAVLTFSLISFSAFKSSSAAAKDSQTTYRWIYWGCRATGTPYEYSIGPNGRNAFEWHGESLPPSTCIGDFASVCAVRFLPSETDVIPGGGCQPKAGVIIWGAGRPYITCHLF